MKSLAVRHASTKDAPALMKLRIEAEEWLARAGIDQWRSPGFRDRALAKWHEDIAADRTWVVEDDRQEVLGTVTLARPDIDFWKPSDAPESAVYVAKLITSRQAVGLHLGGRILDWVGSVARERNKPWVRLDCWRTNVKLQRYYLDEGFEHVRTEAPEHRLSGWMAQRPATVTAHGDLPPLGSPSDAPESAS
ncbi:GCN5 family N-acetyltransferase [Streptomyces omiyaensis]|uniref:GNAT family N-acetyltransferase n=1 Tax=Streptomyces omiyaensis TaxID=68247 RepID=UPI00199CBC8E|nr:GNAT family N-acetyltransferase [Streptomyces omiyaensis]GGY71046.1 GCN5 family N-acetyltransferase [Streptomyces omiyaensis]